MSSGLIIDNFAGGGGASTGIERALGRHVDYAINHDLEAIAMHAANHPNTVHIAEDVFKVSPRKLCRGREVDLAWFSPDCTHFSKAKGANIKRSRKIRGLAGVALRWAKEVKPRVICIENVEEFVTWGPLDNDGKPISEKKGISFKRYISRLRNLGYDVEWRTLIASHFGSPTSRKRFFLIARCDGDPIVWPEATHGAGKLPYRTAAECIDWSIPSVSIFATREEAKAAGFKVQRPLKPNTLKRIARGVIKFILEAKQPYILNKDQAATFLTYYFTGHDGYDVRVPLKTVTAMDHHGLITATLVANTTDNPAYPIDSPLKTVTTGGHHAVIAAMLSKYHHDSSDRCASPHEPIRTIDTQNRFGLVTANLITIDRTQSSAENRVHPVDQPMRTITLRNNHALVASYLTKYRGENIGTSLEEPVQTITASGSHHAQVTALLISYYGQGIGQDLNDPLRTQPSREKFGLVTVHGEQYEIADIGLRMLSPRELARAQGLPDSFVLIGTRKSQVGRIGNMVPPDVVEAIVKANATWIEEQAADAA